MNTLTALLAMGPIILSGTMGADGDTEYTIAEVLIAPQGSSERQFGKNVELIEDWIAIATDTGEDGSLKTRFGSPL